MDPATSRDISLRVAGVRRDDTYVGPACPRVRPKESGGVWLELNTVALSFYLTKSFQSETN
jgi:hypothetical protein